MQGGQKMAPAAKDMSLANSYPVSHPLEEGTFTAEGDVIDSKPPTGQIFCLSSFFDHVDPAVVAVL